MLHAVACWLFVAFVAACSGYTIWVGMQSKAVREVYQKTPKASPFVITITDECIAHLKLVGQETLPGGTIIQYKPTATGNGPGCYIS